jgi:hypothetical protein
LLTNGIIYISWHLILSHIHFYIWRTGPTPFGQCSSNCSSHHITIGLQWLTFEQRISCDRVEYSGI